MVREFDKPCSKIQFQNQVRLAASVPPCLLASRCNSDRFPRSTARRYSKEVDGEKSAMSGTKPKTIGDIIGVRRLVFRDAPRKTLVVTLGKPRRMKGHQDWECPFCIKGAGMTRLEFGYGVDALQAL